MGSNDFITNNIRYSYSSLNTYYTCPYSFKLTYIDRVPRVNNFYGEYGTLVHMCMEQFFSGALENYELSGYYRDMYDEIVKTPAPEPPFGLGERYKQQGFEFFDSFSFDRDNYEVVLIEDKIDFDISGMKFVAKPDLVLKNKKTGMNCLLDYKTSAPYKVDKRSGRETTDKKKLEGYYKQMFIYTHALDKHKGVPINNITLWFTRPHRFVTIPWEQEKEDESVNWLNKTMQEIGNDEEFVPNPSEYFCKNLCSVRVCCEYSGVS